MTCRGSSGSGSLSAGGRTAQKGVQAAAMSFDDVAEMVVCEDQGTQVDSGVRGSRHPSRFGCGLEPLFLSKTDGAMVFVHEGGFENDGVG